MKRRNMYVSIRFPDGDDYAVGPVEMDRAGRILFRMLTPNCKGMCSYTRIVLEGVSAGDGAEAIRNIFITGLAFDPKATVGMAETLDEALAMT
jgi:hypothetical protein